MRPDDEDEPGPDGTDEVARPEDDETWARPAPLDEFASREISENESERIELAADIAEAEAEPAEENAFVDADPTALDAASGVSTPSAPTEEEAAAAAEEQARQTEATRRHLRGLLESLLFVADRPMKTADLCDVARADAKEVRSILEELSEQYRADGRGFQLDELAGGWQMRTSAAFAPFVRELTNAKPVRLSRAQTETLAIIAYRQPITRPEIEDIRGVDAGAVLKLLLDRDMVRVLGKKDEPGRPLLYGTTSHFLGFFGLKSLKDLPTLREFTELTEESREVVERELGEVLPEGPRELPPDVGAPLPETEPIGPAGEPAMHHAPEEVHTEEEAAAAEADETPDETDDVLRTEPANDADASEEHDQAEAHDSEPPESSADEGADEPQQPAGGSNYDPSDEELFPDDDDEDFDDEDEDDEDEDEDEDDEGDDE